jgi:hypothetical protein
MRLPALTPARIEAIVLGVGVFLRICDFLLFRSLWLDEAMLARNLIDRSPAGLFTPLDYDQAAPIGFLVAQKLVISVFGTAEWAFRLLPCVLGVWALFLFARLSREFLGPPAALIALALFAFDPYLVVSTGKQYPVDVWAVLYLLTLVWRVTLPDARRADFAVLAVTGACLVWISHPVPLVAAGCGAAVIVWHAGGGRWGRSALTAAAAGCWLASFVIVYLIALRHVQTNAYLNYYWQLGFPPSEGGIEAFGHWARQVLLDAFSNPAPVRPRLLGAALALVGTARLVRDPLRFGLIVLPVAVAFGSSVARLLPFQNRLILFLVPFLLWLIASGLDGLLSFRFRAVRLLGSAGLILLLWHATIEGKRWLLIAPRWEESRVVFEYVAVHRQPGDVLYVPLNARHTFEYYRGRLDLAGLEVVHGRILPPADSVHHLEELPTGRRVWVYHTNVNNAAHPVLPIPRVELLSAATRGRPALDRLEAPGVCVALFGPRTSAAQP